MTMPNPPSSRSCTPRALNLARIALTLASLGLPCGFGPATAHAEPILQGDPRLLLWGADPDPRAVARAVRARGFWDGAAFGAGACAGCHPDAAAQWGASAHRFSSFNNPYYAAAIDELRAERGGAASRFCAGCHDPVLLATGGFDDGSRPIPRGTPEAQAGVVCLVCHSIDAPPERIGNGEYHALLGPVPTAPGPHRERLRPAHLGMSDLCGACHKVGLPSSLTGVPWQRGQDELDAWIGSSISGRGAGAIHRATESSRCQDCHMPLEPAPLGDAAAKLGPDGVKRIRSHRFLGANTALPLLRDDREQLARTAAFLRERVSLALGWIDERQVDVVLRSRGVGHRFPGGTMDSNEVWIEVEALDARGRILARSGGLDPRGELDRDAHRIRAQPVDARGRPLRRRDVQHTRGVVFDASLGPGDPQAVRFSVPPEAQRVRARLLYRKLSPSYARFACEQLRDRDARKRCLAPPVLELGSDEVGRPIERDAQAILAARCLVEPWEHLLDHGIALTAALAERVEEARPLLACAAGREPRRVEPVLGLARLALREGQTDEVLRLVEQASGLAPAHPAPDWLAAQALVAAYRVGPARAVVERLVTRLADDPSVLALLARVRGLDRDPKGALQAAERLLEIDPDSAAGHYQRLLSLRELGQLVEAERAEQAYLSRRGSPERDLELRRRWRSAHSDCPDESEPLHAHPLHLLGPLDRRRRARAEVLAPLANPTLSSRHQAVSGRFAPP